MIVIVIESLKMKISLFSPHTKKIYNIIQIKSLTQGEWLSRHDHTVDCMLFVLWLKSAWCLADELKTSRCSHILIVIYQLCHSICVENYSVTCGFGAQSCSMLCEKINKENEMILVLTSIQTRGTTVESSSWRQYDIIYMSILHPISFATVVSLFRFGYF